MLEQVKGMLLEEPEHIVNLLELYDFHAIKIHNNEIRCAYDADSNPTSVVIRLVNNDGLYVTDYGRNVSCDLIDYLIKERKDTFKGVLNNIKRELGITSIDFNKPVEGWFGGIFNKLRKNVSNHTEVTIYPEELLDNYQHIPNYRFARDGISWTTQEKFGIGFDIPSQRITIPIRSATGDLIGVKGRLNDTPDERNPKYLYLVNCTASQTLYGYYENYENLLDGTVIIFESEKSVMQLDSMDEDGSDKNYHIGVALGSNSLSATQAKLINRLHPKRVIFALDNSLNLANTARDAKVLLEHAVMQNYSIEYFNWEKCTLLDEKDSPTDKGKRVFDTIMKNHIEKIEDILDRADEEIVNEDESSEEQARFFENLFKKVDDNGEKVDSVD